MPQPWSTPLDVDRLSRGAAAVDFELPLVQLPRLQSRAELLGGSVRGMVRFGRDAGHAVAEVSLEGAGELRCQRCMRPMELPLRARTQVVLLASEAEANTVAAGIESVLASDGRISLSELVEEEVLLSLPIVPMHESDAKCQPLEAAGSAGGTPADAATQRPFAQLGELLSHK